MRKSRSFGDVFSADAEDDSSDVVAEGARDVQGSTSTALDGSLLGKFVAYALAYAYMFCMLSGSAYLPASLFSFEESVVCRICLLAFGGACLLFWRVVKLPISNRRRRAVDTLSMLVSLLPIASIALVSVYGEPAIAYVCWALAGFTLAHLYIKLTPWICQVRRGATIAFMGAGSLLAALLFLLSSLVIAPFDLIITAVLPFGALAVGTVAEHGDEVEEAVLDKSERKHARHSWDALLYTLVQCGGLGLGLYCLLALSIASSFLKTALFCALSLALASGVLVVDWKHLDAIDEERVSRYLYVLMFVPIGVLVFVRTEVALCVCGCILVATMWVVALVGCSSEAESARAHNLRAQSALSRGWGLSLVGMGAGMLGGFVGLWLFGDSPEVFGLLFALAILFVLVTVALANGPRREKSLPEWKERPLDFGQSAFGDENLPDEPDIDDRDGENDAATAEKLFADRCDVIGDTYGLSSRQREVFFLLVRGRDSRYIQEKLVISKGTADTHIHNIYRKLNVHSRQELLDLFEGERHR